LYLRRCLRSAQAILSVGEMAEHLSRANQGRNSRCLEDIRSFMRYVEQQSARTQ